KKEYNFMDIEDCIRYTLWSTKKGNQNYQKKTNCSLRRKPCVWKKCFVRKFQKELSFMGRREGVKQWQLQKICEMKWFVCFRRFTNTIQDMLLHETDSAKHAMPVLLKKSVYQNWVKQFL